MMRSRHRLTAIGIALAVLAGACGSSDSEPEADATSDDTTAGEAGAADDGPTDDGTTPATEDDSTSDATDESDGSGSDDAAPDDAMVATEQVIEAGEATVTVPAGAPQVTATVIDGTTDAEIQSIIALDLQPSGATFDPPVTISVPAPESTGGGLAMFIAAVRDDDGGSEAVPVTQVDGELVIEVGHFSEAEFGWLNADRTLPDGDVAVKQHFVVSFDASAYALSDEPVWDETVTPRGIEFIGAPPLTFKCIEAGTHTIELWGVQHETISLVNTSGFGPGAYEANTPVRAEVEVTCVNAFVPSAGSITLFENHPGGDVPDVDFVDGLSALMAAISSPYPPGHLGLAVDNGCDGPTPDDMIRFGPTPIDGEPGEEAALIIDQFGCHTVYYIGVPSGLTEVPPGAATGGVAVDERNDDGTVGFADGSTGTPVTDAEGAILSVQITGADGKTENFVWNP